MPYESIKIQVYEIPGKTNPDIVLNVVDGSDLLDCVKIMTPSNYDRKHALTHARKRVEAFEKEIREL